MLHVMSAMLIQPPGMVVLTDPGGAAADLKASLQFDPDQGARVLVKKARTLIEKLLACSEIVWEFNVRTLKDDAAEEALRRELLATLDYLRMARSISAGEAGRDIVEIVASFDGELATELATARDAADKPLRELELATRFLLEDDDSSGEIEKEFGLLVPSDDARGGPAVKLDLN